ncbi:type II secretion system minor pseudopilin GspJ [Catenovulum sp. 2E275]|uniref:type II secretion system minor pseudopilin GspJ n=1 Tax=Catenovulum sp. 2E275 TaxID=2980497 RepID=UPI0021D2B947|nr:type II secretion system minor pseudopilin GspJ [Catenovulum sp. 2E275]MCU4674388.1 type II secretion system minor pseudopilin GspJ [Catenovulum sp. 2E275]
MQFSHKQLGFTLIEMLLAIAIFALLGLAGTGILSSTVKTNEVSLAHGDKMAQFQRAMLVIERDLAQLAERKVRANGEQASNNLLSHGELILDSDSEVLAFRRLGWVNPMNILPRSEVQSIAYRVYDGNLERMYYDFPDPVKGEEPKIRILLEGVEQIHFEFYDSKAKSWKNKWESNALPAGIQLKIESKEFGEITRIFTVPSSASLESAQTGDRSAWTQ